jgi:branched-chain amino acid transport system ATP-binding protein
MLEIEDLYVSYGEIDALHEVCLHVESGEVVSIVGANGSGKTTLLRSISGLVPIASGRIVFYQEEITRLQPEDLVRRGICQVPEGRHIFPTLSVFDNLEMGVYLRRGRRSRREFGEDLDFVFGLFPVLKERTRQKGGSLSGGEQQMLAIARALVSRPKLMMLDEPSMGLAPLLVRHIFATIRKLNDQGLTVLLVEQDVEASLSISARGYVLQLGRVALEGTGPQLLANSAIRAIYLGKKTSQAGSNME